MTAKFKWALIGIALILNNEIATWAIITVLAVIWAWPIIKGGVTLG